MSDATVVNVDVRDRILKPIGECLLRSDGASNEVILQPHVNPAPQHREIWLRDPDNYVLVIASRDGEARS